MSMKDWWNETDRVKDEDQPQLRKVQPAPHRKQYPSGL